MVLAAGRGTRLGELGSRLPKVLIELGGQPLLARHLAWLESEGIHRVVVNAHHQSEQIETFIAGYRGGLETVCLVEETLLGTAGGVRNALEYLEPGPFIVIYGDVVFDDPLEPLVRTHEDAQAAATLAVHEAASAEGKGVVTADGNGRATAFLEKQGTANGPVLINSGLYILDTTFVDPLPRRIELDFGHDVFPAALARGEALYVHRLARPVIDIGTLEGIELAQAAVVEGG